MSDYEKTVRVSATNETIVRALTTTEGLSSWWTRATGSGEPGGELRFWFDQPSPCVIRVEEATSSSVRWAVASCDFLPDWVGTRPEFTIALMPDGASSIHFQHRGLTEELECIDMCTRGWDHFIASLATYVESGQGQPLGSPGDRARRVADV